MKNNSLLLIIALSIFSSACKTTDIITTTTTTTSSYKGTGSVSQGVGKTTTVNLFPSGMRVAGLGTITSTDSKTWTVPAEVNFTNASFPMASDLNNSYVSGHSYANTATALAGLTGTNDIVTIDATGDIYTVFIFADNYFEMYVNGIPVGKDPVPYTNFNSNIVRFKAKKPFTVAVKCVDWEEHLGVGTEDDTKIGDGGFVAVFRDATNKIIAVTNNNWKAQTFYTAPISDLACLSESGTSRLSTSCPTQSGALTSYGVHWTVPSDWYSTTYDDSSWQTATVFTNSVVGVDNKPAYTNFTDIFDSSSNDASFIWSSNLLLDNLVLLRKKIE
jgi:hypothetical protein